MNRPEPPPQPDTDRGGAKSGTRRRAAALLAVSVPAAGKAGAGGLWSSAWPFPAIVSAAFFIAWGAECAQFLVSRGLALAILAWMQALPEFAVEAVIAWSRQVQYM